MGVPLPATAYAPPPAPHDHAPPDTPRMRVPGREQDFGPLPPDYAQVFQGHGNVA
ncbi:hypothetical protein HDZ31DRAFT_48062 [Schizophyllum fasciatum]